MKIDGTKRHMERLVIGERYCLDPLEFAGWARGSVADPACVGSCVFSYFDDDGTFRGPDAYGIEPVFYMDSVITKEKAAT